MAGIAGPGDVPRSAGRWLVTQVASLHSPEDVQVCVLTGACGQAAWEWVTRRAAPRPPGRGADTVPCWSAPTPRRSRPASPNCRPSSPPGVRHCASTASPGSGSATRRLIAPVFDGSRKLRSLPGAIGILRQGPRVGVYSICLDAEERLLPAECQAVAAAGPDGRLVVQQVNQPVIGEVRPEYVTSAWADQVARSIAPIRDVSGDEDAAGLPGSCRLLDILGLDPPAIRRQAYC